MTVTWFLLNTTGNREFLASLEKGEIQIEETNLLIGLDLWDKPLPDVAASGETPRNSAAMSEIKNWNKQRQWRVRFPARYFHPLRAKYRRAYPYFKRKIAGSREPLPGRLD